VVAIVGVCTEEDELEQCRSFIEWALDRGWPLLVRPHPLDRTKYWERWKSIPGLTILNESIDFETFLEKHRPRLLATWHSTTIFDGIRRGIVPISWSEDGTNVEDTVFPFEKLSLHWPSDAETVAQMFEDEKMRNDFATEKYAEAIGGDRHRERGERCLPETIYR
jgi:hypothetical protein